MPSDTFTAGIEAAVCDMPFANIPPIDWGDDDWNRVIAAIRRLTPTDTDTAIPAGWKLVPVEPTEAMVNVGHGERGNLHPADSYARMLAASPKPDTDTEKRCSTCGGTNDAIFCSNGFHAPMRADTPVDSGVEGVREARRLARTAFALEVSQIDRDALLTGLTDDEIDSIIDGVLSAAALAAKPIAGMDAGEVAWREGWADAKACLTDDEAFCLTVDVEEDAWRDSATRAAATNQEDGK